MRGREEAESIVLLKIVLRCCFTCRWERVVGQGRKSYLAPAETSYFSSQDLIRHNKHDLLWLLLHFLFSRHCCFRFTSLGNSANSQADNDFYKYICFCCFKYYTVMLSRKNWKWSTWYISNGLQKKLFIEKNRFFSVDYVKISELHLYTHDVTCNLSRWNNEGSMSSLCLCL